MLRLKNLFHIKTEFSKKGILPIILFFLVCTFFASIVVAEIIVEQTVNSNKVLIKAEYEEYIFLVSGFPKLLDLESNQYVSLTTLSSGNSVALKNVTSRGFLSKGIYNFSVKIKDSFENIRTDYLIFEVNPPPPMTCIGNGVDPGEECDDDNMNGVTCDDIGVFSGGTLLCDEYCNFDIEGCNDPVNFCGDGRVTPGEQCDGGLDGKSCSDFDGFLGGTLKCIECLYDTSLCTGGPTGGFCGDDIIEIGEQCDGGLDGKSCSDFGIFTSGTLECLGCKLNTLGCKLPTPRCGDGVVNGDDLCDGTDFGDISGCSDFSAFVGGFLKCTRNCHFDTSYCSKDGEYDESCIDTVKDNDETDVDCGGSCPPCSEGKSCKLDSDCSLGLNCKNWVCTSSSCTDNEKNGLESDVDCGGACPSGCDIGQSCSINKDCASNFCNPSNLKCDVSSCDDGFYNGDETDVDCGGPCLAKCLLDQNCISSNDCQSGFCEAGICSIDKSKDTDGDGIPDWWELKYGLDPEDPYDADEDFDDDGFSNYDEYVGGTDPTDPTDPFVEHRSHVLQIILLIFGLLFMILSIIYLVYVKKKIINKFKSSQSVPVSGKPTIPQSQQGRILPGMSMPSGSAQQNQRLMQRPMQRNRLGYTNSSYARNARGGRISAPIRKTDKDGFVSLSSLDLKGKDGKDNRYNKSFTSSSSASGTNLKSESQPVVQKKPSAVFEKLGSLIKEKNTSSESIKKDVLDKNKSESVSKATSEGTSEALKKLSKDYKDELSKKKQTAKK